MDWLFIDDDDQIFEDDEALRRAIIERETGRRCSFGAYANDIDNDYEDPYGLFSEDD